MLLVPPGRGSAPGRNMDKQLWDSRLRVDNEAEQLLDFKHSKWEFPITAKVRAVCSVPNI